MGLKLVKKQGAAQVSVEHLHKGEVVTEQHNQEQVGEPKVLNGPVCEVGFEASLTTNLGNYNSTRIGCSLRLPCLHHELDQVFDFAMNWVNAKMEKIAAEIQPGQS